MAHAVQTHTSRDTEIRLICPLPQHTGRVQQNLFGHLLDRSGDIGVVLILLEQGVIVARLLTEVAGKPGRIGEEERFRRPRFAKQLSELWTECPPGRVMECEIIHVQLKRPIVKHPYDFPHLIDVPRLAIRSHAHHLVFTLVHLEPEERGEGAIEQTKGVGEPDLLVQMDCVPSPHSRRRGRPLPDPIDRQQSRCLKRRDKESTRGVRGVMRHEQDPVARDP